MESKSPARSPILNTSLLKARLAAIKSKATYQDKQDASCCVICLEPVSEKAQAQPCQHSTFDFLCLASWLQERAACPLCNTEVAAIHYAFSDEKKEEYKIYPVASTRSPCQTPSLSSTPTTNAIRHSRRRAYITRPRQAFQPDESIETRRRVYREHLYSLHIGSNRHSRYHDFTPHTFASSTALQSRARKWIRRELRVFEYLYASPTTTPATAAPTTTSGVPNAAAADGAGDGVEDRRASNAEFLLEYIIALLKSVDVQGANGQARQMIGEFLGREHAGVFLHELRGWLRSPFVKLEEWDGRVQYSKGREKGEGARPCGSRRGGREPLDRAERNEP